MQNYQLFSGNPLDRAEKERRDENWIQKQLNLSSSKFLVLANFDDEDAGLKVLVSPLSKELIWINNEFIKFNKLEKPPVFLGFFEDISYFYIDISERNDLVRLLDNVENQAFYLIRSAAEILSLSNSGIVAQAVAQLNWHENHNFCSYCGNRNIIQRGGQSRICGSCNRHHFPRTDPVVITVVSSGEYCLLGQSRGRMTRGNFYSALAGFVDQGETIEEAVAREVMEESGIYVSDIKYLFSQPWPFPYSLMIGCHATANTTLINKDDEEMNDVQWFSRERIQKALLEPDSDLILPGSIAIAHHLIKSWAFKE